MKSCFFIGQVQNFLQIIWYVASDAQTILGICLGYISIWQTGRLQKELKGKALDSIQTRP